MTVNQMARHHLQPVAEIERMLLQLLPNNRLIKEIRYEGKVKVTVFYPAYADGILQQRSVGSTHHIY